MCFSPYTAVSKFRNHPRSWDRCWPEMCLNVANLRGLQNVNRDFNEIHSSHVDQNVCNKLISMPCTVYYWGHIFHIPRRILSFFIVKSVCWILVSWRSWSCFVDHDRKRRRNVKQCCSVVFLFHTDKGSWVKEQTSHSVWLRLQMSIPKQERIFRLFFLIQDTMKREPTVYTK
jgi:hypothetical protein